MPNIKEKNFVIFTDLDGTLLDENYSAKEALPILKILNKKKIPIIFCTAKTKEEQEVIRKKLKIKDPFIVENGSAIFIPKNYFGKRKGEVVGNYEVIILGVKAEEINKEIDRLRNKYKIKGYHNMHAKEIAKVTGLDLESAKRAKKRDFGETVVEAEEKALKELKKKFNVVKGGKFIQVFGKGANKGRAVKILTNFYKESKQITTMGIGNAENDEPMLKAVDLPFIVRNPNGKCVNLNVKNLYKSYGIGPKGWSKIVRKFVLENYGCKKIDKK